MTEQAMMALQEKAVLKGFKWLPFQKERRGQEKRSIGPRMKYGHTKHKSNCPYTNGRCSIFVSTQAMNVYYSL